MSNADHPWVDGLTLLQVLEHAAKHWSAQDALVFPQFHYRCTYAELLVEVRRVARALLALGVRPGEPVGVWATNWPQWVLVQFGAAAVGAPLVHINPSYRADELRYVLVQAGVTTLFLCERFKTSDYFGMLAEICPELAASAPGALHAAACPQLRRVISVQPDRRPGVLGWKEFLGAGAGIADDALNARAAEVQPEAIVSIQYTSGTTGFPKGAMLTHRNLLLNAYYVGQRLAFTAEDRLCLPVPYYHCFGCVMGTLLCAVSGATQVVPAEVFDPLATLQAIAQERCTAVYGVPTMFIAELTHPRFSEFDLSSLRTGIMAGSPCPIELMRAVIERMGARGLTVAYGLTEASPVITQTEVADDIELRVGTVGRPLPGVEVRIVRPGTLEDLPDGEPGELLARGHGIMRGYHDRPEATAEAITPDGWLHTADLAVRTPAGNYRIVGRLKDMIIRGGENVYPREVEEFLYQHPAVAEVQVVGLPDERYVEEVSAWIRLKPGATLSEDEVREFCRGRIAHYKVPRYVVFLAEFPTTVTGKVQKYRLRAMGIERFGLQRAAGMETA